MKTITTTTSESLIKRVSNIADFINAAYSLLLWVSSICEGHFPKKQRVLLVRALFNGVYGFASLIESCGDYAINSIPRNHDSDNLIQASISKVNNLPSQAFLSLLNHYVFPIVAGKSN